LKHAIGLKPDQSQYWSCLAVISGSFPELSTEKQHFVQNCFVEALGLDNLNAEAWTNLGYTV